MRLGLRAPGRHRPEARLRPQADTHSARGPRPRSHPHAGILRGTDSPAPGQVGAGTEHVEGPLSTTGVGQTQQGRWESRTQRCVVRFEGGRLTVTFTLNLSHCHWDPCPRRHSGSARGGRQGGEEERAHQCGRGGGRPPFSAGRAGVGGAHPDGPDSSEQPCWPQRSEPGHPWAPEAAEFSFPLRREALGQAQSLAVTLGSWEAMTSRTHQSLTV